MSSPFRLVSDILVFAGEDEVIVNGIGASKKLKIPEEVALWLKSSFAARRVLEELVTHYKFRRRLCNPGALRSLILLLYARYNNIPPYKVARNYGVPPEQLYRMERGLKKDNLLELVKNMAEKPEEPKLGRY
ncbi:MAG: hypothetical protein P3X22_001570 [Thermoprotei archaeon]|nr:hypothetical protein [Thermoprotei archaeon]